MSEVMTLATQIDSDKNISTEQKMFWARIIMQQIGANGKEIFVYKRQPDIEVEYEDLKRITEENFDIVLSELVNRKQKANEPVPTPVEAAKLETQSTPDMLTNTGYTVVMPPVDENTTVKEEPTEPEVSDVNPANVGITRPSNNNGAPKKPMTFAPKNKSQGGFADILILGVIVLVYIAIIVNLILRLK